MRRQCGRYLTSGAHHVRGVAGRLTCSLTQRRHKVAYTDTVKWTRAGGAIRRACATRYGGAGIDRGTRLGEPRQNAVRAACQSLCTSLAGTVTAEGATLVR